MSLLKHHGLLLQPAAGGGGTPGAWDPADVVMGQGTFTFASSDSQVSNPSGGTVGRGTVRSTTNMGAGEKRYVEISIDNYGTGHALGLTVGFSSTPDPYTSPWHTGTNKNFTWEPGGNRNSYGQTNTDTTFGGAGLGWPGVGATILQMAIEVGVGVTWVAINGGTFRASASAPFTESDVKVFACLGDGNFGFFGSDFALTILTTAATQFYGAPSGFTAWDD